MTDLIAFLRSRLAERERIAQQARPTYDDAEHASAEALWNAQLHTTECGYRMEALHHDCCCDAVQTELAEVDAKRRIIDEHPVGERGYCTNCWADRQVLSVEAPCLTLRLLARPYADHPDFDPVWAVD